MPTNTLITSTVILNKTMQALHNESAFLGNINTEYNDAFAKNGMKAGATVYPRRPVQFQIRSGAVAALQDVTETSVAITVEPEFGIDFDFTEFDRSLSVDDFNKRYMGPAGKRLATELDMRIATRFYQGVANFSGTPGTTPSTAIAMLKAAAILDDVGACPRDGLRVAALNPLAMAYLVDGLKGLLNDGGVIGKQTKTGLMATNLGLDFQMSQNVPTHTVGGLGGTPLVNGANQGTTSSGVTNNPYVATTTVVTSGWTAAAANRLKKGDVINFAGVYAVNLENKNTLSYLKDFVVTADAASDGTGGLSVIVSPGIISGGAYQTVSALPANSAAITVRTGTAATAYPQNMLFHRDAMTMVTVAMDVPNGMDMAEQITYEGVSLRFVRGFDITNNLRISRFDLMAGFGVIRPEWAVRVSG